MKPFMRLVIIECPKAGYDSLERATASVAKDLLPIIGMSATKLSDMKRQ